MTQRIKVADLPEFDAAPHLDSKAAIAAYLADILEANDPALLAAALGDIARARGMNEIAKASGLTREALYKALRPNAKPRCDTIAKVCGALGVIIPDGEEHRHRARALSDIVKVIFMEDATLSDPDAHERRAG